MRVTRPRRQRRAITTLPAPVEAQGIFGEVVALLTALFGAPARAEVEVVGI